MDAIQQTPGSRASNLQRYLDQARKAISEDNTGALASLLALFEGVVDHDSRTYLAVSAAWQRKTECLRVILTHGVVLDGRVTAAAASGGSLACLRLAHRGFGDKLRESTVHTAAWTGLPSHFLLHAKDSQNVLHICINFRDPENLDINACAVREDPPYKVHPPSCNVDCLLYAIEHGCSVDDRDVESAACHGKLDFVKVLVARGLPREAFMFRFVPPRGQFNPGLLRCLKHILDNGRPIHPSTLIIAATGGDLDTVRCLHTQGVQLWAGVYEEDADDALPLVPLTRRSFNEPNQVFWLTRNVMAIPRTPEDADHMWKPLLYGWANGAPVTPVMEEMFRAKRAATRGTLLCFHVATRLSQGERSPSEQRATWAAMGHIPTVLVEKIIMHAEFEMCDTWGCSLPKGCGVRQEFQFRPHVMWMQDGVDLVDVFRG